MPKLTPIINLFHPERLTANATIAGLLVFVAWTWYMTYVFLIGGERRFEGGQVEGIAADVAFAAAEEGFRSADDGDVRQLDAAGAHEKQLLAELPRLERHEREPDFPGAPPADDADDADGVGRAAPDVAPHLGKRRGRRVGDDHRITGFGSKGGSRLLLPLRKAERKQQDPLHEPPYFAERTALSSRTTCFGSSPLCHDV